MRCCAFQSEVDYGGTGAGGRDSPRLSEVLLRAGKLSEMLTEGTVSQPASECERTYMHAGMHARTNTVSQRVVWAHIHACWHARTHAQTRSASEWCERTYTHADTHALTNTASRQASVSAHTRMLARTHARTHKHGQAASGVSAHTHAGTHAQTRSASRRVSVSTHTHAGTHARTHKHSQPSSDVSAHTRMTRMSDIWFVRDRHSVYTCVVCPQCWLRIPMCYYIRSVDWPGEGCDHDRRHAGAGLPSRSATGELSAS